MSFENVRILIGYAWARSDASIPETMRGRIWRCSKVAAMPNQIPRKKLYQIIRKVTFY